MNELTNGLGVLCMISMITLMFMHPEHYGGLDLLYSTLCACILFYIKNNKAAELLAAFLEKTKR